MTNGPGVTGASMLEKVTLLALADLSISEETPANPLEVRSSIQRCIDPLADDVIGMPDEADISRALNALEADHVIDVDESGDRSPIGKGRPSYTLRDDPHEVLDDLSTEARLETAIAQVNSGQSG